MIQLFISHHCLEHSSCTTNVCSIELDFPHTDHTMAVILIEITLHLKDYTFLDVFLLNFLKM